MSAKEHGVLSLSKREQNRDTPSERLHKVMANAGLGSRRALEARIRDADIEVNDATAEIGMSVATGDRVTMDQHQYVVATDHGEHARVIAYNKPEGQLTTRDDPQGRETVFDHLADPSGQRWIAVGRLDINTSGLLLLTTDGELANALMHPSGEIDREYLCRVQGEVTAGVLEKLQAGIELEDGPARFEQIVSLESHASHAWFRVVIREGRNREVRRIWEAVDCQVSRLKRIRYGCINLPRSLKRGDSQDLHDGDTHNLRQQAGIGKASTTLTLKPVSGQRRARRTPTQIDPSEHKPSAWTGTRHDEARELTAWDRSSRPESGRRRASQGPRRGKGGKEVNGNLIKPDNGNGGNRRKSRRKAAPGQELPAVRSWFAGDNAGGPGKHQNHGNKAGNKPGNHRGNRGNRKPGKPRS